MIRERADVSRLGHDAAAVSTLEMVRVNSKPAFFRGFGSDVAAIWAYRELLVQLIRRELKVKYKESVLGFFWTLARPALQVVVYYLAFQIFLRAAQPWYAIFIYSGLLIWGLFTDIASGCTGSILSNQGLVKKTYFPREIFPLAVTGAAIVNFGFQLLVMVVLIAIAILSGAGFVFTGWMLLLPLAFLVVVVFGTALGLLLAAYNVYFRDLTHLIDVILMAWFWMAPVVYSIALPRAALQGSVGWALYLANPIVAPVLTFQKAFYQVNGSARFLFDGDLVGRLSVSLAVSLVLLFVAQRMFARLQGNFAQEM